MLNIEDLPVNEELDRAALRAVRGGMGMPGMPASFFGVLNAPTIDNGFHSLMQGQSLAVDQGYNLGGLNLVISDQTQNGVAGQISNKG